MSRELKIREANNLVSKITKAKEFITDPDDVESIVISYRRYSSSADRHIHLSDFADPIMKLVKDAYEAYEAELDNIIKDLK